MYNTKKKDPISHNKSGQKIDIKAMPNNAIPMYGCFLTISATATAVVHNSAKT